MVESKESSDEDEDDDLREMSPRSLDDKRVVLKTQNMKQMKMERDAINEMMIQKQKAMEQGPAEIQWEWTEVCGKIVDLGNGHKALMYISVKRNGCKVVIEQEVANNEEKNKGGHYMAQNIKIVQRRNYFNQIVAEQVAKDVFQRFIKDECFPLTEASQES